MMTKDVETKDVELVQLSPREIAQIQAVVASVAARYRHAEDAQFTSRIWRYIRELPEALLECLYAYKYEENNFGVLLVRGFNIDDQKIGRTPTELVCNCNNPRTLEEDIFITLCSSVLGDLVGWRFQRNGDIINDIVPVKGHEHIQAGTSSAARLQWHVEEAFHDYRADHLALLCLRNPTGIETTFASVANLQLDEATREVLSQPRYIFNPYGDFVNAWAGTERYAPVLFGDCQNPYVRIDPADMQARGGDSTAAEALGAIVQAFNNSLRPVVLRKGDICFIDNYRVVHGRSGFTPKYDGSDRWLKRVNIVRDLRKSRDARASAGSRVIMQ
ncbi:MAG: TauD/TfdA family dioxygenase [Cytophagales bacterium]|nr:TauD/TfdA family dioxygenase [Cytophagales bacterium]